MTEASPLFLGLDLSTQSLKATIVDECLTIAYERSINFDADLPGFGTQGGVHRHSDGLTVTSPALMWVAALDRLLDRMQKDGAPLHRVLAISGSGQQHGSVWLKSSARSALRGLHVGTPLHKQLESVFSVADSPIWMDSSTGKQCAEREAALGGAQNVADRTGSRAYERFTGNQIAKIAQLRPTEYAATAHISLVSSFIASLLIGDHAPIDASDGSGMNLMNLRTKRWDPAALEITAPELESRLGGIVASHEVVGTLHAFYAKQYHFPQACIVVAFSGDNPNSLAGLRLESAGDLALSLGTSDTLFGSLSTPKPLAAEGHLFANPVDPAGYMAMICRKNGSLAREYVRDRSAQGSWETFRKRLMESPPGNRGVIGIYALEPEITPPITRPGVYAFGPQDRPLSELSPAEATRAVLESQFLSMRLHGERIGLTARRVIATGGASVDRGLLRVVADVFGTPVYLAESSDSASRGAAYRALHGWTCRRVGAYVPFKAVLVKARPFQKVMDPDPAAHGVYTDLLPRLDRLELGLVDSSR